MKEVQLPLDILEKCIELADDPASLLACSLAGRLLRSPSQRLLFKAVDLTEDPNGNTHNSIHLWEKFCAAMETTSELGRHVQCLIVHAPTLKDEGLIPAFSRMYNLTSLDIRWKMSPYHIPLAVMPWSILQPNTQQFLLDIMFPRLTSLFLGTLRGIPAVIFRSLRSLEVLACNADIIPPFQDVIPLTTTEAGRRPLTHLYLYPFLGIGKPIGYAVLADYVTSYRCQLREITINEGFFSNTDETPRLLMNFIKLFSFSVTSLHSLSLPALEYFVTKMSDTTYADWFRCWFDLTLYTSLSSFSAELSMNFIPRHETYIQRLAQILESGKPTQSSSGLRQVCIYGNFRTGLSYDTSLFLPVAEALGSIPNLDKVCFRITFYPSSSPHVQQTLKELENEILGMLAKAGFLGQSDFVFVIRRTA
ncbi:hypothetical protein DL96DRAFT_1627853 [Flagelloscypha sp. PMI_526]|nr:hypothetical protein DL96DRAFT_1627853 [Flagelloscypha sp. PMI_526]